MPTFKISTLTLAIFVALSLSACNLPKPKDREDLNINTLGKSASSATFSVDAVSGDSLEDKTSSPFAFPEARVFTFKACLKDSAEYKSIAGHIFKIAEIAKQATTDTSGCLSWSERIAFNYLSDSKYIRLDRTLVATGLHRGSRVISVAINPWSHGESLRAVIDLRKETVPGLISDPQLVERALKGFDKNGQLTPHHVWAEDGRLVIMEQQLTSKGVVLLVELRATPTIQLRKMNGDRVAKNFTRGRFKAQMSLIHSYVHDNKEIRRRLGTSDEIEVRVENSTVTMKTPINIPAVPTRGQVILGLKLVPLDAPEGLKSFEGVYMMGEYDHIKGSSFLRVSALVIQTPNFKIDEYVQMDVADLRKNKDNEVEADVYQTPRIEARPLEFRFPKIVKETTTTRTINFNVRACINHGVDQRSTRAQTFTVTKFRQSESEKPQYEQNKTLNHSCIIWSETIEFNVFSCQQYYKGFVNIANEDLGMNQRIGILINPWEVNSDLFARDLRDTSEEERNIVDCRSEKRPRPLLKLDNFSYKSLSHQYKIDNNLNLSLEKRIQVRVDASLLSYSNMSRGYSDVQRLRDGVYVLKVAIVRNRDYDSERTYVSSDMKVVQVLNGQVNADLTFATHDLKALGNRNTLLVELYPAKESAVTLGAEGPVLKKNLSLNQAIAEEAELETPTYQGAIVLTERDASTLLNLVDSTGISQFFVEGRGANDSNTKDIIDHIVQQGLVAIQKHQQRTKNRSQLKNFVAENNLAYVNLKKTTTADPLREALKISTRAGQAPDKLSEKMQISSEDLRQIITKGEISDDVGMKLCSFWMNDYFQKIYHSRGGVMHRNLLAGFAWECAKNIRKNPSSFFKVERRLLVKDLEAQYQAGYNFNLGVTTSFSLNTAHTRSATVSQSLSARTGLSKKFLDIFSISLDYSYQMNWSQADSNAQSNSLSVNTNTYMVVEQNVFQMRFKTYEQCAVLRLNPLLFIKDENATLFKGRKDYLNLLNPNLSGDELAQAVTRGIMVCEGELRHEPLLQRENYYLISQEIGNSAQQQDAADARNRNFFLALRSDNDFQRFATAIKGRSTMPQSTLTDQEQQVETMSMMERLFLTAEPSYPGMYLLK